jgi:uncharacterized membrane protein YqiK
MDLISPGIINLLVIAGIIVVALLGIGFVFSRLYRRTTRDTAFVRTGLGGRKVVVDGGAVLLPVFHSIAMVNLNTLRLEVKRSGNDDQLAQQHRVVGAVTQRLGGERDRLLLGLDADVERRLREGRAGGGLGRSAP